MTIALHECQNFFKNKGLKVNAGKCGNMRVLPVKGKKSMKVLTDTHRCWNEVPMPTLNFEKFSKYLAVFITYDGEVALPITEWKTQLERLRKCHLNPLQKVQVIRQVVSAKMLYQIRLSDHGLQMSRKLHKLLRNEVKKIFHLPSWTGTEWLHHTKGGNIPNLLKTVMISRKKASEKMKLDEDPIARQVRDRINPLNGERLQRIGITGNNWLRIKEEQKKQEERVIARHNNGRAILTMFDSKISRDWIWIERGLSPGDKIRCIQALSNTTPNRMNKTRGETEILKRKCRQCKTEIEDDHHILNKCRANEGLITKRHDYLVKKIAKELQKKDKANKVWLERSWRKGREIVRPDITVVKDGHCQIIEITCPYEVSREYLQSQGEEKNNKYKGLIQNELNQVECNSGEVLSIVIGSLGTMLERTNKSLKRLTLTKHRQAFQMTAIKGTVNILNSHMRRDDSKKD